MADRINKVLTFPSPQPPPPPAISHSLRHSPLSNRQIYLLRLPHKIGHEICLAVGMGGTVCEGVPVCVRGGGGGGDEIPAVWGRSADTAWIGARHGLFTCGSTDEATLLGTFSVVGVGAIGLGFLKGPGHQPVGGGGQLTPLPEHTPGRILHTKEQEHLWDLQLVRHVLLLRWTRARLDTARQG